MRAIPFADPTRAQFDAFKGQDHDLARDGLTGAEARALYGKHTNAIFNKARGRMVWRGSVNTTRIGPDDEQRDTLFIARDPAAHACLAMIADPDYKRALVHSQAGVATSRAIRTQSVTAGAGFA